METTNQTPIPTELTSSTSYDNISDSANHRRATEVMLAANEKEGNAPIVNFCPYAGKQGRPRPSNNHNKTVAHAVLSGTVLWLVCPFVNNFIARIERSGGVKIIDARLKTDEFLGPLHEASHRVYEAYVTQTLLQDTEEQARFLKMFVLVNEVGNGAKTGNWNRKYGNAGVSAPRDLKCFHAVAAQALGGAANPLGCVLVLYLFFLYDVLQRMKEDDRQVEAEGDEEVEADGKLPVTTAPAPVAPEATDDSTGVSSRRTFTKNTAFATFVDDFSNFETFLNDCVKDNRLVIDDATQARLPELTTMCKEMLMALEGHQPFHRKKRRIH